MNYLNTLLAILLSSSLFAQNAGDQLFFPDLLHEIRIESPNSNFLNELINEYNVGFPDNYQYLPGKVWIDGIAVDSVGIRVKGGLSAFDNKRPLKLDFNEFRPEQEFDGLKKVNLHNAYFDASMQREAISYEILRYAGLKTPRTAYTEVYINDELQGVYTIIEQIDKTFLKHYFADNDGVLYKTSGNGLVVKTAGGTFADYDEMINAVTTFSGNELRDTLEKLLDTEALLRNMMTQNIINATDNLIDVDYNYYLYHEPKSNLLYYIPWDFNLAFFQGINYPVNHVPFNQVGQKMLQIPEYQDRYLQLACETLDYNFLENRLYQILDSRKALIENAMPNDPNFSFTIPQFEAEQLVLKNWITSRIQQAQQELEDLGYDCQNTFQNIDYQSVVINEIVSSNDSIGGIADPAGSYADWIELYNNTEEAVALDGLYLSDDKDFKKHWKFPKNTIIEANSYLIVWADRDVNEEGLHTDFKLEKNGGELFLINEDFSLVDSVEYEVQETNVGFARVPNGAGDFVFQPTTFSNSNEPLSTENRMEESNWSVFPNPSAGIFQIKLSKDISRNDINVVIFDVFGKVLKTQRELELNLTDFAAGIYFLQLEVNGIVSTKKLMIDK